MELSVLCDVKVFLFVLDKNSETKLLHYQSDLYDDFIQSLYKDCCNPKNFYSNDHYNHICGKSQTNVASSIGETSEYCHGPGLLPLQQ